MSGKELITRKERRERKAAREYWRRQGYGFKDGPFCRIPAGMYFKWGTQLAERDGGNFCHYCGIALETARVATVDHVIPRSAGGTDDLSNLVLCCGRCNSRKGTKSAEAYKQQLREEAPHAAAA